MTRVSDWWLKLLLIWDVFDRSPLGRFRRLSRPIDGWLTRREEAVLFRLASRVRPNQCIVELGSWFGRSAVLLGGGSRHGHGAIIYAVDLFRPAGCAQNMLEERVDSADRDFFTQFQNNIQSAGLADLVTPLRGDTAELGRDWSGPPVGLLFIDADHSYSGVRRDWLAWRRNLATQARVAFHDYGHPDPEYEVTRFVDELKAAGQLKNWRRHDSILVAEPGCL